MVMKSGVFQMAGLLLSDKASSVVYTTKKNEVDRKVTITWAVCTREVVEFEGEGLATNEATLFFPFEVFFSKLNFWIVPRNFDISLFDFGEIYQTY